MLGEVNLSSRRVMKKIQLGKARPAIFHQFDVLVELSDGSVVKRRSQAPKDEIRMISDQRNSALWNPFRSDLTTGDPNARGKVSKFKQKYNTFDNEVKDQEKEETEEDKAARKKVQDEYLELLGENVQEVQSGGKLFDKKSNRNR